MVQEKKELEGWREVKLGDVVDVKHGYAFKGQYITHKENNNILVTPGNFHIGGGFKSSKFKYFDGDIPQDYILKEGDIIVTMTDLSKNGDTLGYSAKIPKSQTVERYLHNQRVGLLQFESKDVDLDYIYWLMRTHDYHWFVVGAASGTSIKHTSPTTIKEYKFLLPPLPEQKAIAEVLSSLDDKIDLLHRQNKTLEDMAQTLFRQWFGKYKVGDKLPDGWEVVKLGEMVNTINGYSYKGKELVEQSDQALVTLKSFDRNGGFQIRGFKPFVGYPKETQEVKIGDLVVAHTDLTQDAEVLGNPALIFDNTGFKKTYITMDLVKVISKNSKISKSFLYYLMKSRYFKGHCVGYSNGTTVLHLSKRAIPEYELILPKNKNKIINFSKTADRTTEKIIANLKQISTLENLRDTLLPKLMSGEVRVK